MKRSITVTSYRALNGGFTQITRNFRVICVIVVCPVDA